MSHDVLRGVSDALYVLTFALLMLSTDRYNPMVKHKMSLSGWLHNTRSVQHGMKDERSLITLYESMTVAPMIWKTEHVWRCGWVQMDSDIKDWTSLFGVMKRSVKVWLECRDGGLMIWSSDATGGGKERKELERFELVADKSPVTATHNTKTAAATAVSAVAPLSSALSALTDSSVSSPTTPSVGSSSSSPTSNSADDHKRNAFVYTLPIDKSGVTFGAKHGGPYPFALFYYGQQRTFSVSTLEERAVWLSVLNWNIHGLAHGLSRFNHFFAN